MVWCGVVWCCGCAVWFGVEMAVVVWWCDVVWQPRLWSHDSRQPRSAPTLALLAVTWRAVSGGGTAALLHTRKQKYLQVLVHFLQGL